MLLRKAILKILCAILILCCGTVVFSEVKYSIKDMTPEVKAALDARRSRFDALKQFKIQGTIGENNSGYVELLADNVSAQEIVDMENADRKVIYQTIAEQNELTQALATIEKVFAQVQRDKADAGEKIQLEDGTWISK